MKNKFSLKTILAVIGLSSCQEVIDVDLKDTKPQLMIEGKISNINEPAKVSISKTIAFSETNKFVGINGAVVIITDQNGVSETLNESETGVYLSNKIKGIEGTKYILTVKLEGQTYTATSTMPKNVKLQGLNFDKSTEGPNKGYYLPTPNFVDPQELGNNYHFIQYKNNKKDITYFLGNDNLGNGVPNVRPLLNPTLKLAEGDDYILEMRCIDKPVYDYFYTLQNIAGNGPGGGTTPSNPPSNISGGVLGYFAAYTSQKIITKVKAN